MNQARDIDLVNDLLARPAETSWIEFKHNNSDPATIGELCSALSNSARLEGQSLAYIVWGIENLTHAVLGTSFDPLLLKVGNQELQLWLASMLKPSIAFNFRTVAHPAGRVVLMEIPAATSTPVSFKSVAHIRIGSATPKLADFPDRHQALIEALRPYAWEHNIATQYISGDDVLALIDYAQFFKLTKQPLPDNRVGIFERLEAEQLISKDVGERWSISNLGAILFASDLTKFSPALARKAVRFTAYAGRNRATNVVHRIDGKKGYANGFEGLLSFINNLLPKNEQIGQALRVDKPLFPQLALRELVANALIHQDMTISGAGPHVELFEDRIEITNPGHPLVKVERMIDMPPRSRNEMLAALMRRMGMCEEQGSGLDKVIFQVELFQLPAPLFRDIDSSTQVVLYGPRAFANMTNDERVRACYQHAVLKYLSGDRMKNSTLCERLGIEVKNAAQASNVIKSALEASLIKPADPDHPRSGYVPFWA